MSQTIDEIRAMLRDFRQSPWLDFHVVSDGWKIFLAKPGGKANPMLGVAVGEMENAASLLSVDAPHLGLFSTRVEVGSQVEAGACIGVLKVLDRITEVCAERAGLVDAVFFKDGDLVEYGEPMIALRQ